MTFVNGVTLREPIVSLDDEARRLVWTAEGGRARHYNGGPDDGCGAVGQREMPDDIRAYLSQAIEAGMAAMQRALDRLGT